MGEQVNKVFTELKVGKPVVIITNAYAPEFPEGTIGTISKSLPSRNSYTVTVGNRKLTDLRADQVSLDLAGLIDRPEEANITISNANEFENPNRPFGQRVAEPYTLKRPLSINGMGGGSEVVISLGGPTPGEDYGRIFIEATPDGYRVAIYRPNDQCSNSVVDVMATREKQTILIDADDGTVKDKYGKLVCHVKPSDSVEFTAEADQYDPTPA